LNLNAPLKREQVEALAREAPEALVSLVMVMQEQLVALRAQIGQLQARVAELEEQNRPPSAPFRRRQEERSAAPKKPGRPPGHPGSCRPVPEVIDEDIEVPLPCCPECSGALEMVTPIEQFIEELPAVRPHVTRLRTFEGHCPRCEKLVRSTHPRQMSTAGGCAGVQLGARAVAVAAELKHGIGLTMRKTCRTLSLLGGLRVSAGGLAQIFQRTAEKLTQEDAALQTQMLAAPVLHTDETSWWRSGPCSLWVFTTPGKDGVTLYRVVEHRDRATFHQFVPPDWLGLLVSDCLSVYDTATGRQHKCYSHHLGALRIARQDQNPQAAAADDWTGRAKAFFLDAIALKARHPQMSAAERAAGRAQLEVRANDLFEWPRGDPAQERFRNRVAKQRDHLLTFLDEPSADATNNLAERQLRGAVIARKLSCGNKTARGSDAWEILASLAATCTQRATDFVAFLTPHLRLAPEG
jgi:transposase